MYLLVNSVLLRFLVCGFSNFPDSDTQIVQLGGKSLYPLRHFSRTFKCFLFYYYGSYIECFKDVAVHFELIPT